MVVMSKRAGAAVVACMQAALRIQDAFKSLITARRSTGGGAGMAQGLQASASPLRLRCTLHPRLLVAAGN